MIRIEKYEFGKIVINGKQFIRDIIVTSESVVEPNWWRKEGHKLFVEDIKDYIEEYKPEMLIVGTGYHGFMKVQKEVVDYMRKKDIDLIALPTETAVKLFNKCVESGRKVMGAFHLTC
ncbi:MAG: hypothetical protein DRJ35_03850 [Thermoprotei archaeon]|nr:MAG: hypothetical protein DRJ35_03850 [Thermoprotei archaeon]